MSQGFEDSLKMHVDVLEYLLTNNEPKVSEIAEDLEKERGVNYTIDDVRNTLKHLSDYKLVVFPFPEEADSNSKAHIPWSKVRDVRVFVLASKNTILSES